MSWLFPRPTYPCDMVTMLHVVLYKTADTDVATRQRATNLLQILDRRFFSSMDSHGDTHSELFASLVAGTFSKLHVRLSQQLARSNPELTLPMFSGGWGEGLARSNPGLTLPMFLVGGGAG